MPIHDWTRVEAALFHDFHHAWIEEIKRVLNSGILPADYYALAEQYTGGFGPDVLALQRASAGTSRPHSDNGGLLLAPPKARCVGETEMDFYRRRQKIVAVRHATDDSVVAIIEVVSPGNKQSQKAIQALFDKVGQMLENDVHLLILDLWPPGRRDPAGLHALIWEYITGDAPSAAPEKPLTIAAYESALAIRAYVETVAAGDTLPDMPLFLKPHAHVDVPLEKTYEAAFAAVPRRWRSELESAPSES